MDLHWILLSFVALALILIPFLTWVFSYVVWSDFEDSIKDELGYLVKKNYQHHQISPVYTVEILPHQITLISGSIDGSKPRLWSKVSRKRLDEYTEYHHYNLFYFTQPLQPDVPLIWQKVLAIKEAFLDPNCQAVVWIDDDLLITSKESIEHFLEMTDRDMIFSMDIGSKPDQHPERSARNYWNVINTGIFILRKTNRTLSFLEDVLTSRLALANGYFNRNLYNEQSVMTYHLYSTYVDAFILVPMEVLQTLSVTDQWKEGHFSLHLAGESPERRNQLIQQVYDQTRDIFSGMSTKRPEDG